MCIRVILVSAFTTLLLSAAPAGADDYSGGSLTIDDPTLDAGDGFIVTGTGCPAGAPVAVAFDGQEIGATTAGADGAFELTGTVPSGTAAGQHTSTATCADVVQSLVITVPAPTTAGTMPRTGADIGPIVRVAATLVLAGIGLVLLARHQRRRTTHRPA